MKIQIMAQARPVETAAAELKNYLMRMGCEEILPQDWQLGVQDLAPYGITDLPDSELDDAYYIEVSADKACIYGSNARSVLLGVYRYLTEIGCRFLRPGAEYEIVPQKQHAEEFFAHCAHKASLRHRGACIEGATSIENILDFIDWSPKIGFNSFFLQFKYPHQFLQRWYDHVRSPKLAPQHWSMQQSVDADAVLDEAMKQRGILQHRVGHGWTGEALGYTATGWDTDDAQLPEEKTALLAEIGGKRELFGGVPTNTNLCYSNPKVVELYSEKVLEYVREHPEVDYLHLWLADMFNNACECEQCRKKILTDHYIHMMNVVDEKLTREGFQTKLVFLLYQELLWAPETETLHNPDRFVLMFAPITRTFMKSYQQAGELPPAPPYVLNHIKMPRSMEDNLTMLKGWQKKVSCDSFIYDYHLGKAHYGDPGYVRLSRIISDDLKAHKSLGMNGISSCQELRAFLPNALPNYVMGQVAMDTEKSFNDIASDYYQSAYGVKWTQVFDYLEQISDLYDIDYFVGYHEAQSAEMQERFKKVLALIEKFEPVIRQTLAEPLSPVQKRFWRELSYHKEYVEKLTNAMLLRAEGADTKDAYRAFTDLVRENEPEFQKSLDVYRVVEVTQVYTKFKEA